MISMLRIEVAPCQRRASKTFRETPRARVASNQLHLVLLMQVDARAPAQTSGRPISDKVNLVIICIASNDLYTKRLIFSIFCGSSKLPVFPISDSSPSATASSMNSE